MNPMEFIRKNIISELEKLGYQGGGIRLRRRPGFRPLSPLLTGNTPWRDV